MIEVKSLTISYNGTNLFENIDFSVPEGTIFTLTGESGKGKSSIFSCLMGFIKPASGIIKIDNEVLNSHSVRNIRNKIAWLPQNLNSLPNLPIREQLQLLKSFKKNSHLYEEKDFLALAVQFRLREDILSSNFSELSGGEKQRVVLILSILQKKPIIFLDEPTSALDDLSERAIIDFFRQSNQTIIASSHSDVWISQSDNTLKV